MRKIRFLTKLNAIDCCQTTTDEKLIYFSTNSCKLQKKPGQSETSVFEIRAYTPYYKMSFIMQNMKVNRQGMIHQIFIYAFR